MRRLLTWIAALTTCASLLLISVRAVHPAPASTACIQLLSPTTGDVVTVDVNTGAASLDTRNVFPTTLATPLSPYLVPFSPDHSRLIEAASVGEGPPAFKLSIRKPSTSYRRLLTPNTFADRFTWSPDSRYIAFTEMRGWGANGPVANLTIADAATSRVDREIMAESLDDAWFERTREFVWSPDSTLVALAMYHSTVGATLALRSPTSDQSNYVSLSNEQISYISWSPNSQVVVVVTTGSTGYTLFVIQRNGQLLKQTAFYPNFNPYLVTPESDEWRVLQWSPDGQYFFFTENSSDETRIDVFNLNGERQLAEPLVVKYPFLWAAQPHTLIFVVQRTDHYALYTLDAATGQSVLLEDDLPLRHWIQLAYNNTAMLVITTSQPKRYTPHLISMDLIQNTTPFGTLESDGAPSLQWSPDNQQVMIVATEKSAFALRWLVTSNGEMKAITLPRQGVAYEFLNPVWLTNDFVLLTHLVDGQQTLWSLDTRSSTLTKLLSAPEVFILWGDDHYLLVIARKKLTLFRLSDGVTLFSDISTIDGMPIPVIAPDERILLLFRERDSINANPSLDLITNNTLRSLSVPFTINSTPPTWSSDGSMFAFGVFEDYEKGWRVKVMSRDGTLLKDFPIVLPNNAPYYQQISWTNCD